MEAAILYNNSINTDRTIVLNANFKHHSDQEYKFVGQLKGNEVEADIKTTGLLKRLIFKGEARKVKDEHFEIVGVLRNVQTARTFDVKCPIAFEKGRFSSASIHLVPRNPTTPEKRRPIKLSLRKEKYGIIFESASHQLNSSIKINLINPYNWDLRVDITQQDVKPYNLITFMNIQVNGNTTLYVVAKTPWEEIENFVFDGNLLLNGETGNIKAKHRLNHDSGNILLLWRYFYLSDMFAKIAGGYQKDGVSVKDISTEVFLTNNEKAFKHVSVGFDINADEDRWRFATNASIGIKDHNNVDAVLKIRLPPPNKETHNIVLTYHVNNDFKDLSYVVCYSTDIAKDNFASDGSVNQNLDSVIK